MLTRGRLRSISTTIAVTTAIALNASACGEDQAETAGAASPADKSSLTESTSGTEEMPPEQIVERAVQAGADLGDPSPTDIEWTYSTPRLAARLASRDDLSPSPNADTRAIVIQARGSFVVSGEPAPQPDKSGATVPPPTGTAFILIIDAGSGDFLGINVKPQPIDLSELGPVMQAPTDG